MLFKETKSLHIDYVANGHISISQHSIEFGKIVDVYLTIDQFRQIQKWVDKNEVEISEAWNNGVEDA